MTLKGFGCQLVLIVLFFLFVGPGQAPAQKKADNGRNDRINPKGRVLISSKPSGAIVHLEGLYKFTGRTPFVVPYPLRGPYKIKTTKKGYESFTSNMSFVGKGEDKLLIRLSPKTRGKAAIRSLVFPGWGQVYGGQKLKGTFMGAIQLGLGIWTLFVINDYNDAQDDFERALRDFELSQSEDAFRALQDKESSAGEAYNSRNTMLIVTGVFWVYNLFDSIVLFSNKGVHINIESSPVSNRINNGDLMLSLKIGL